MSYELRAMSYELISSRRRALFDDIVFYDFAIKRHAGHIELVRSFGFSPFGRN